MTTQEITTTHDDGGDRQTYWAERINGHLRKSVEEIIQAGLDLIEAKKDLGHGNFTAMVEEQLQCSLRTAERLMKIADNPALSNPTHGSHLPVSMRTLSELAAQPPQVIETWIANGSIHADMEREDVAKLASSLGRVRHVKTAAKHKAKMTPILRLKEENEELKRQKADLEEELTAAETGDQLFEGHEDVEVIVDIICVRVGESKAKEIAAGILRRYKKPRGRPKK